MLLSRNFCDFQRALWCWEEEKLIQSLQNISWIWWQSIFVCNKLAFSGRLRRIVIQKPEVPVVQNPSLGHTWPTCKVSSKTVEGIWRKLATGYKLCVILIRILISLILWKFISFIKIPWNHVPRLISRFIWFSNLSGNIRNLPKKYEREFPSISTLCSRSFGNKFREIKNNSENELWIDFTKYFLMAKFKS